MIKKVLIVIFNVVLMEPGTNIQHPLETKTEKH